MPSTRVDRAAIVSNPTAQQEKNLPSPRMTRSGKCTIPLLVQRSMTTLTLFYTVPEEAGDHHLKRSWEVAMNDVSNPRYVTDDSREH